MFPSEGVVPSRTFKSNCAKRTKKPRSGNELSNQRNLANAPAQRFSSTVAICGRRELTNHWNQTDHRRSVSSHGSPLHIAKMSQTNIDSKCTIGSWYQQMRGCDGLPENKISHRPREEAVHG